MKHRLRSSDAPRKSLDRAHAHSTPLRCSGGQLQLQLQLNENGVSIDNQLDRRLRHDANGAAVTANAVSKRIDYSWYLVDL
ncbi:hypothetical protein Y032_0011g1492 [Ancylostoma ceylanicum]|nr:hypothetical protein Y032_0011g1492 [Ancylostoma ceylanicum]